MEPKVTTSQRIIDNNAPKKAKYDVILTIQQAINMATAEGRVVRFLTEKSNKEIKAEIVDMKGCALRKPAKESNEVAVIPAHIQDFCFEESVNTAVQVQSPAGIIIPKPKIWLP